MVAIPSTQDAGGNEPVSLDYSFQRIEEKFFIHPEKLNSVLGVLTKRLTPDYPHSMTLFTDVESIYFDSKGTDFFQKHFDGSKRRAKIRLRSYSPNGIPQSGTYLECKIKIDGVSKKHRFAITDEQVRQLFESGKILWDEAALDLNEGLDETTIREYLQEIAEWSTDLELRPIAKLRYRRQSFRDDLGIRLTLDRGITVCPLSGVSIGNLLRLKGTPAWLLALQMSESYKSVQGTALLELKHSGSRPSWFLDLMQECSLEAISFSKYCWGITQIAQQLFASEKVEPKLRIASEVR